MCGDVIRAQTDSVHRIDKMVRSYCDYFDSTTYWHMFNMGFETRADSIWYADEDSRTILETIVYDDSISTRSRFIACEILFDHCEWDPQGPIRATIASIYATALRDNYTGSGNAWGLPENTGDIGDNILQFGELLVIAFKPLLNCERPVIYFGSRTATSGQNGKFRVKDIAASYICAVRHIEFDGSEDPAGRDRQIRKIKRKI